MPNIFWLGGAIFVEDHMTQNKTHRGSSDAGFKVILEIMLALKLKDLKKLCRNEIVNMSDFVDVIVACEAGLLPWTHHISFRDFIPRHLHLNEIDTGAISRNGVGKFKPETAKAVSKLMQLFNERRYLVGHIFYLPDHSRWTFFYFDQRDTSSRNNHFVAGAHIHVISHLMPGRSVESVWTEFRAANPDMKGSLHVRWDNPRQQAL